MNYCVLAISAQYCKTSTGTPDEASWPGVTSLPDYKSSFPRWPVKDVKALVPNMCPEGQDLLQVS